MRPSENTVVTTDYYVPEEWTNRYAIDWSTDLRIQKFMCLDSHLSASTNCGLMWRSYSEGRVFARGYAQYVRILQRKIFPHPFKSGRNVSINRRQGKFLSDVISSSMDVR